MTVVTLSCGKNGVVKECKANGHAGFSRNGTDIVCAAVTTVLRTAMQVLSQTEAVALTADTSSRGNLAFRVDVAGGNQQAEIRLACIADFIRAGISSLARDYPANVQLREATIES